MQNNHPFRRYPTIPIEGYSRSAVGGRSAIVSQLRLLCQNRKRTVIVAECYPGVDQDELRELFAPLEPAEVIHSDGLALPPAEIDILIHRDLTDDPVFGILTARRLDECPENGNRSGIRRGGVSGMPW